MSSHNSIESLNKACIEKYGGMVFVIEPCGATLPNNIPKLAKGFVSGAILINPNAVPAGYCVWANQGTIHASDWTGFLTMGLPA
jgi:hypothetical protein